MKRLLLILTLLALFTPAPTIRVFAQEQEACDATPEEQQDQLEADIVWFDCEVPPEPATPALGSGGTTGPLAGCSNAEKVWNFLKGKGMSDIQAAGSMGNLQHEGAFNPKIVEGGVWGGRDWPPEMDTIPPPVGPQGQPGYGIVQWTSPGRKDGLQAMSDNDTADPKRLVHDLTLQLDYMWSELSGAYKERALDPLMTTNDLAEAVRIWQDKYEVGTNFQPRFDAANDWLNRATTGNWCG